MNAFAPSGLVADRSSVSGLTWTHCRAFLAWDSLGGRDAAPLYATLVGRAPQHLLANKFPTSTMPCWSWASGTESGWRYDLRLGVHGLRDEFEVAAPDMRCGVALGRLRQASRVLSGQRLAAPSLHLDLELEGPDAQRAAEDWAKTLCSPAAPGAAPHVVESEEAGLVLRHAGEFHATADAGLFVLRIEVLPLPGLVVADPVHLFERLAAV